MEDKEYVPGLAIEYYTRNGSNYRIMSSPENEIVEVVEENHSKNNSSIRSIGSSISESINNVNEGVNDEVYVAVGKDDLDVVQWALDHVVSPGARLCLVHVFPPITYIPTPVGKLARSQLTEDQVRFYIDEEENRRRNLLQKYIRLCKDAKVNVDTVLVEHDATAKAIVDLISIHKITSLVMGLKRLPNSRILKTRMAKGEYVKKSAPEFCEVTIVHDGKKFPESENITRLVHSSQASSPRRSSGHIVGHSQRSFFPRACFSGNVHEVKWRILKNSKGETLFRRSTVCVIGTEPQTSKESIPSGRESRGAVETCSLVSKHSPREESRMLNYIIF